jgi:hypothetical protein
MEKTRFDVLVRCAAAGSTARRGFLNGLAAAALSAALAAIGGDEAAAKKKKGVCQGCPKVCETRNLVFCKPVTEDEQCACARTTSGTSACLNFARPCADEDECRVDGDCGPEQACVSVRGGFCCNDSGQGNQCLDKCGSTGATRRARGSGTILPGLSGH